MKFEIISEIAIVFFIVSPGCSVSSRITSGAEEFAVSVSRNAKNAYDYWRSKCETVSEMKKICCPGYKNISGTCTPECSPICQNGYCALPNICHCNIGWGGNFCEISLFCTIAQPVDVNSSQDSNRVTSWVEYRHIAFRMNQWYKRPKCSTQCLDQVNNMSVDQTDWENMRHYLIPIASSCNSVNYYSIFLSEWGFVIGGVILILFTIVTCTVCIVRKKGKKTNPVYDDIIVYDSEYDYAEVKDIHSHCQSHHHISINGIAPFRQKI